MNSSHSEKNRRFESKMRYFQSMVGISVLQNYSQSLSQRREHDRRVLEQQALGFESEKGLLKQRISQLIRKYKNTPQINLSECGFCLAKKK